VQVAPISDDVPRALQFFDLATVHAMRGEAIVWFIGVAGGRGRRRGWADGRDGADPPARISHKGDDVRHLAREGIGVGRVGFFFALLHRTSVFETARRSRIPDDRLNVNGGAIAVGL